MQPNGADDVACSIDEDLKHLPSLSAECCIFRVHKQLRRVNEKAYEPEIIAIGPYHRGKGSLQMMEKHKLRYFQSLLQRKESNSERYVAAIRSLEEKARRCYSEPLSLSAGQMIKMLILDGCFVIELMRKFERVNLRDKNDDIFKMEWIANSLQRDLMLFENQLPFFVLCELFDLIEHPNHHARLVHLALKFFRDLFPGSGYMRKHIGFEFRHLLGLIHNNWLPLTDPKEDTSNEKELIPSIPSITELREAGVKLEKMDRESLFDIKFKNGVMLIPPLTIEDRTECFFRNLIACEQYCPDNQLSYVTDYVKFMDCLINSPKDVQILSRWGIINNQLGDNEVVSTMVNKICDAVTVPSNHVQYADIFKKVNIHCSRRWNRWMAKLNRNYLNSPWAFISILAALVLLLLTLTQTIFTVFPLNK